MATDVTTLINDARQYALTVLQAGNAAIGAAMATANALGNTIGGQEFPLIDLEPPRVPTILELPEYEGEPFEDPGLNANPPQLSNPPDLNTEDGKPGIMPTIPPYHDPTSAKPSGAPGDTSLLIQPIWSVIPPVNLPPDLLGEIASIPVPVIHPIVIPPMPAYVPPQFTGTPPTPPPAPPTGLEVVFKNEYSSMSLIMRQAVTAELDAFIDREFPNFRAGLAAVESRLETYLAGGTALTGTVQDQMFARAVTKTDAEFRRGRAKVYDEGARAGHTLPSPVLLAQVQSLEQERRNGNAAVGRDLMVKMAEMEQQNLQFAVTQSITLRGIMINAGINYYQGLIQINGQAIEYAKTVVGTIVEVYGLSVKYCEIQARIYEAEAAIYQAKIQGSLATIQAYTAQIRALEAQAQVDLAAVQAYTARIAAVQAEANVYAAYVQGVTAQAMLEKTKADVYVARVGAYGAQVNSWIAQWHGYSAAVSGETAKIQAAAEQVKAYSTQVNAYQTLIQAQVAEIDAVLKQNEGNVRVYESSIRAYQAHVAALAEVDQAMRGSFELTLKTQIAQANLQSEHSRAEQWHFEAALKAVMSDIEVILRTTQQSNLLDVERVRSIGQLASAAAANYAQTAMATLSGMNTLVSQSAQE